MRKLRWISMVLMVCLASMTLEAAAAAPPTGTTIKGPYLGTATYERWLVSLFWGPLSLVLSRGGI